MSYPPLKVPLWPSVLVTTTATVPAACAAVVAVMDVLLITVTFVAVVPQFYCRSRQKSRADQADRGSPPADPEVGEMELTEGAGFELV